MNARSIAALACAAAVLAGGARAHAQDAPADPPPAHEPTEAELAEARHSFEVGMQAYDAGEFSAAASEFRAAYDLTRAPDLLFNVYLAEEHAGRLPEAADALEAYLRDATMEADQRALLARRLDRLRARIASRTAQTAPPEDTADQRAEDLLAQELLRDSADAIASPVTGHADPTPPVEPPPPPPSGPHPAGIGLLVGAGVLAVGFAVLAPLSEVEDQAVAGACGRDVGRFCDPADTATLEALSISADVSWIGAATLAVVGVVLIVALPPEGAAQPSVAVAPVIAPGTIGAAAGGRF